MDITLVPEGDHTIMSNTIDSPLISSFVAAVNDHDAASLAALFGDESIVIDDGTEYRGKEQIARWIHDHMIAPKIILAVTAFDPSGASLAAEADGDFPGGPLPFRFQYVLGERIDRLEVSLDR